MFPKFVNPRPAVTARGCFPQRLGRCLLTALLLAGLAAGSASADGSSVRARLAAKSLILDAVAVDGALVVVGERGHILLSEDEGASWAQMEVATRYTLTGTFFLDKTNGWAVGHGQAIVRTRDGGNTWQKVHLNLDDDRPLFDVWFRDARYGIAVGAYGLYLVTEDGGDSWKPSTFTISETLSSREDVEGGMDAFLSAYGEDEGFEDEGIFQDDGEEDPYADLFEYSLNHIARTASGRLYLAGEAGRVYRSEDDGKTWICLESPYEGSFFGVLPLEEESFLAFGLRGNMFRFADGGKTWEEIATGTKATLMGGVHLKDGSILVSGLAGTLLLSRDGGRTFERRPGRGRAGIATVTQSNEGTVILVGQFGVRQLSP